MDPDGHFVEAYEFVIDYLETDQLWEDGEDTIARQLTGIVRLLKTFCGNKFDSVEIGSYCMKMYLDQGKTPPAMAESDETSTPAPDQSFNLVSQDAPPIVGGDEVNIGVVTMPHHRLSIRAMTLPAHQTSAAESIVAAVAEEEAEVQQEAEEDEVVVERPKRAKIDQNGSSSDCNRVAPPVPRDFDGNTMASKSPSKCSVVLEPIMQDITSCSSGPIVPSDSMAGKPAVPRFPAPPPSRRR